MELTATASSSMGDGLPNISPAAFSGKSYTPLLWQHTHGGWSTLRILLHCDNQAVVHCIEQQLPNPLEDATNLRRLLRGIKRLHGVASDTRFPITPNLLCSFRFHHNLSYIDHITLWTAMVTAFFGFLRSNELLALQHDDIQRDVRGYYICIKCSKQIPSLLGPPLSRLHLVTAVCARSQLWTI